MSQPLFRSPARNDLPSVVPPARTRGFLTRRQLLLVAFLSILLLTGVLGDWSFLVKPVYAASPGAQADTSQNGLTFQQFLSQGRPDHAYHGYPIIPTNSPSRLKTPRGISTTSASPPPSVESPTMKPIVMPLASVFLTAGATGTPLDLKGSDGRLEVMIQPGTFDLAHAIVAGGGAPQGTITLHVTQISGHFTGFTNDLGAYQVQLLDSKSQVISSIHLRTSMTFIYHYQPAEMAALQVDPGKVSLSWAGLLAAEKSAHAKVIDADVPLRNDPVAHTLTGQSTVIDAGPLYMGWGTPSNQAPPTLHLASVQGNSGQFTYSYPLYVAPGIAGFAPQIALKYSSSGPNERHSLIAPAGPAGDGWSVSLGSISIETYPDGSSYYFLNDVAGVGDRLLPGATTSASTYDTEHTSHLLIQYTGGTNGCFKVWDKSGTYYELGCTSDSLQYWTDSLGGRHNYRWDVNKMIAPNEGSASSAYRAIWATYLQDISVTNSSVRDAAVKQIYYGFTNNPNNPPSGTNGTPVGTIDFTYMGPLGYIHPSDSYKNGDTPASITWETQYLYGMNYTCTGQAGSGSSASLRCDDPVQDPNSGSFTAPTVFSTLSLQSIQSYVGDDSTTSNLAYSYSLNYTDTPNWQTLNGLNCTDPTTGNSGYCAGEHLLNSITPTVYQNGTGHALKSTAFTYQTSEDTYSDTTQHPFNPNQYYQVFTDWQYLTSYFDNETGEGVKVSYAAAYNNAHGTPTDTNYQNQGITDNRYDPMYCPNHVNASATLQCTGPYTPYDDHAWEEQVVTQLQSYASDSSGVAVATVKYNYLLAKTGSWDGKTTWCEPDQNSQNTDCVGDNWLPKGDTDYADYYHGEYQGFAQVQITSPAGDLTTDNYYSTAGWYTPENNSLNYLGPALNQEDIYRGTNASAAMLLQETVNTYLSDTSPCIDGTPSSAPAYYSCETVLLNTKTTNYEQRGYPNSNAPYVQHDYTYDDYSNATWTRTNTYHNLTQDKISGSNLGMNLSTQIYPLTKKLSYAYHVSTSGWTYYTVDAVTHSEIDDATGHVWQCQNTTYDENTGNSLPTAGWPTTVQGYTNGCNANSVVTTYNFYDLYGNRIANVDGAGAATQSLYSSNGCSVSLPTGAARGVGWPQSRFTTCTTYDAYNAQPVTQANAFFSNTATYDYTQGAVLSSTQDPNGLSNTYAYSYDSSGNRTVQVTESPDASNYTRKSSTNSACSTSSTLPCFEVDTVSYQYNTVTARTFYDSMGRAVETRTPGPGTYDTISITMYNDAAHAVWKSNTFEVASGSSYIDPNNGQVTDRLGHPVYGVATYDDALGRVIAVKDQNVSSDGFACSANLTGAYTSCVNYSLGQASMISNGGVADLSFYVTATSIDADKHVSVSYADALGHAVYALMNSGTSGGTLTPTTLKTIQYNALDKPTSMKVLDITAQSSVTTTASYNDLGWMTGLNDPDQGTHAYTLDGDGRVYVDAVGGRTIGYVYDLLGRLGCVEDAYPSFSPSGACNNGNHLIQNTYDSSKLQVTGTTDAPIGQLTQSIATTIAPDSSFSVSVTETYEHDIRGRLIAEQMQFGNLPGAWGVSTALPTYLAQNSYNDADQVTQSTSSAGSSSFTTYTIYNSANGWLSGIGKTNATQVNLASYSYNAKALVSDINFKSSSNSALLDDQFTYDNVLRPLSITAAWQSGSGNTGNAFTQTRSYDAVGNVVSLATTQAAVPGNTTSGGSETQVFCYDEQNRLAWAGNTGTPTCTGTPSSTAYIPGYSDTYRYNHLGELTQGPLSGSGSYVYLYCNSQPHELSGLYPSGTTCANKGSASAAYSLTYDAFGRVATRTLNGSPAITDTLGYDKLDRLVQWSSNVSGQTQNEQYLYDASGERVLRRSTSGTSSSPTTSLTVYAFGQQEYSYSGTGTSQGTLYYYYLGGRLIGSNDGTNITYYLTDAQGSVLSAFSNTASSAAVKGNQLYDPYGASRYSAPTINTAKGYTGQYNDSLTGLDYYHARYYDPAVGVFLTPDSAQGNMQGMNPYAYVNNNPETQNDPTGRRATTIAPSGPDTIDYQALLNDLLTYAEGVAATLGTTAALSLGVGLLVVLGASALIVSSFYLLFNNHYEEKSHPHIPGTPSPEPAPTPDATPSTDTSGAGARCQTGRCYDLAGDEGYVYTFMNPNGTSHNYIGHTLANHVYVSDEEARLRADGRGRYSVFNSLDDARWAVQYLLDHSTGTLNNLAPGTSITLSIDTKEGIGWGYQNRNPNRVEGITGVTAWIYKAPDGQIVVMDAYPTIQKYTGP